MPAPIARWIRIALFALSPLALATAILAQTAATAEDHKTWMNDAADAQEDFREAIASKNAKAAATALTRIDGMMARTEAYWAAKKSTAGVKSTKATRAQAAAGLAAAKAGKLDDASAAFDKMNATCNTCHELHLEKS